MASIITIRPFESSDLAAIITLFKEAVTAINSKHYSPEQILVWIDIDEKKWLEELTKNTTFVAIIESTIVGVADLTHEGYLDRLYIHKNYRGGWVSLHLLRAVEKAALKQNLTTITIDCSITAKLPAERMGFVVIKEQIVEKKGMKFINYRMEKKLAVP